MTAPLIFRQPWFVGPELDLFLRQQYACVYAIGPHTGGPIKIGWGVKLPEKLAEHQAGNWHELTYHEVTWTVGSPLAVRLKTAIHKILDDGGKRLRGDWFDVSVMDVLAVFQQATDASAIKTFTHEEMVLHIRQMRETNLRRAVAGSFLKNGLRSV